ncbi:DEAD/DEAH box helicase family protein [Oscillatoriales cyanobacterium LEGE 11467]|uniref:DEAD/DEAH box helicase family protein n=1 Tax=Zarconia navalis LEGE 11467 TaxID=1828826 RepID=A0A928VX67_9CYAN|nr:type I restriction endonuclease subunit R [Zarconia navalis]MBE9040397.1 DEAD/DEAH box helicase family protein [Zarconia navalis LEGE 11467]
MNEADTRAELIDPALRNAGWGVVDESRTRREVIAPGRLVGSGRRAKPKRADYVLSYRNQKLAVIEAKANTLPYTEGVQQAKDYAQRLQVRYAYATNGVQIYQIDMLTGAERDVERYPSPDELWEMTFSRENEWRDRFAAIPFEDKSGTWEARYYQHNAITKVLEAIANNDNRILLTLATGTGKTCIAFQIAWKLFHSRWNLSCLRLRSDNSSGGLSGVETRRPRILFLADRNILADQAFLDFSAFQPDALVRIDPEAIAKKGKVPKNGSIFFTIFQTFMTEANRSAAVGAQGDEEPQFKSKFNFREYPPNFFDLIIIDECHRGGANDQSTWRGILEYFSPAVQLGLTATPRREINADTYDYFGEPVYTYSLASGIDDGYLTPFKVCQIQTNLDEYAYSEEDFVSAGTINTERVYTEADFNRIIEMRPREAYRVRVFMDAIDQNEKTLVFCAIQDHALMVRDLINQMKVSTDPNYCARVTANDGALGEQLLKQFQDNEKTIPTILTTSQKLSTGVNARNVRNIVLMRPINSTIEFKQIIGRGTRLFEGKDYFTIYDFVRAHEHFNDPEWDGEPQEPPTGITARLRPRSDGIEGDIPLPLDESRQRPEKIVIQLADGKERSIQSQIQTTYWSPDGKPLSATEFVQRLYGELPNLFRDEAELRRLWSRPDTRQALLEGLAEKGYGEDQIAAVQKMADAENSDIFDVLAFIAYAKLPLSRPERVLASKSLIFSRYTGKQQEFLDFVLDQYICEGVGELNQDKLPKLLELKYRSVNDAISELGDVRQIIQVFINFQECLYFDRDRAS